MVNIKINDVPLQVEEGLTVLQACRQLNIDIPTLCYVPMHLANEKNNNASCRVCVVEIKGRRNLAPSCSTLCTEGMEVYTNSQRVIMARRTVIELMIVQHVTRICIVNFKASPIEWVSQISHTKVKCLKKMNILQIDMLLEEIQLSVSFVELVLPFVTKFKESVYYINLTEALRQKLVQLSL